jgi:hypothetical protein
MPGLFAVTAARPDAVGSGSDGALDAAAERYPWLRGVEGQSAGSTIFVSSLDVSPVVFQTVLRPAVPGERQAVASGPAPAEADFRGRQGRIGGLRCAACRRATNPCR